MKSLDLYISGKRVDLFNDEAITITIQQQNIKDISKVFSDFTQSFTLPASKTNNRVFAHYYRTDLLTGYFDATQRTPATIELGGVLFRTGVIQLEAVTMENGKPSHYAVTFYGNTTSLIDLFGNDKLKDLDLSAYRHKFNLGVIRDSVRYNNLKSGNVSYPLITYERNWQFGSGDSNDIEYDGTPANVIAFQELKPALRVKRIIEAIGTKYGIAFTGSFLNESQLNELYLLCHAKEGNVFDSNSNDIGTKVNFISVDSGGTWNANLALDEIYPENDRAVIDGEITMPNGTPFKASVYMNGEPFRSFTGVGTGSPLGISFGQYEFEGTETLTCYVKTTNLNSANFTFDLIVSDFLTFNTLIAARGSALQFYELYLDLEDSMPDMKIIDFLTSIIKMFNLTITPTSNTSFSLQRLDDWYSSGSELYATKTISTDSVTITRPSIYKKISFKYEEAGSILAQTYFENNAIGYADAEAEFDVDDGSEFEIKVGFEPLMFERLTDLNSAVGTQTQVSVGKMLNKELTSYIGKPVLLYHSGLATLSSAERFGFGTGSGTPTEITQYHVFGQATTLDGVGTYSTLNFGAPIDPFALTPLFSSLYAQGWQNYISGLYSPRKRQVKCSGSLTFRQAINLEPNSRIIWNNDEFVINSATLNLMTGDVTFDLLNLV